MRRRDGGAGRKWGPDNWPLTPAVGRPGNPALRSVRRPGVRLATGTRAASGLRPGAIPPCQELADRRKCRESAARRRKENAAAERREARRWAVPPAISGEPEIGPTARRAMGAAFRTSACRRSAPLISFERSRNRRKGHPPPPQRAGAALACSVIPGRDDVASPESITTGQENE